MNIVIEIVHVTKGDKLCLNLDLNTGISGVLCQHTNH